ncbi:MAG TPA: AraC family transcriptional regulator [Micromonosporaceae bacterium]|nr:AraC family transcriptional regulator [Micromonosporaceae bacterium]
MVGNGQILAGTYGQHPAPGWAGVGTTTLRDLTSVTPTDTGLLLDHHSLFLVTVGRGSHEIDFRTYPCRPGTLLWARPGQVARYLNQPDLDAVIVCWDPQLSLQATANGADVDPTGPTRWQLAGEDEDAVITEVSQLVVDCSRHRSGELAADLLRQQLAVLLLRISLLPSGDRETTGSQTYQRMRQEVERSYDQTRRVEDYAERLNCSVRTLTRACLAATGRSAKQIIDDRVALQAMRLLAASDVSVAEIGRYLGFSEPTNFGRFFHREVGCSPGAFRSRLRRPAPSRIPAPRRPAGIAAPVSPATGQLLR